MQSGTPFETTAFGDDWIPALAPRAKPGSLGRNDSGLRSEPHVRAGAKQVGVERHVAGRHEGAIEAAVEVAELEAGADRPARRGDAAGREARQGGIDVADREAAGEIRQEPVQGIAEAAAHGRQPVVARRAAGRAQSRRRSPDVGPVDVALDAERGLAELPIVADGAADQPARHVEPVDAVPLRAAPAAAAVDAEIEAGPAVARIVERRLVAGQHIRRHRRAGRGKHADTRNDHALHLPYPPLKPLHQTVLLILLLSSVRKTHINFKYLAMIWL